MTVQQVGGLTVRASATWGGFVYTEAITFEPGTDIVSPEWNQAVKAIGERVNNRAATVLIPLAIGIGIGTGLALSLVLGWILS